MLRKVSRIFFKTLGILMAAIILLAAGFYFGIQSYSFQTWLGDRAGSYLSSELHNTVRIETVKLDFFSKAHLKGILVLDKHKDTLFCGNIDATIKNFNYEAKKFRLDNVTLTGITSKIVRYRNDSAFNFQFIADYFAGGEKDTSDDSSGWDIKFGDVVLDDVNFNYRDEKYDTRISKNINYNNILLKHTSGSISGFRIDGDTIYAGISHLRTSEQCGFELQNLSTDAKISSQKLLCDKLYLKTSKTLVKGKVDFSSKNWDDYADFLNKVALNSVLEDSTSVSFSDVAVFTSELNGLDKTIDLSGKVKGTVSDLKLSDFKLAYGRNTKFAGNLSLSGLPDFKTSFLHFDARELSTSYNDIITIPSYPFNENKKIELPIELKRLGVISFKGKFDGFVTDFTTYGQFKTELGNVNTKLSIRLGEKQNDVAYDGKIKTESFNLGTLLGQKDFNGLSLNCQVKGKGVTLATLDATMEGEVAQIGFNGYNYKNIKLNGSIHEKIFSGLLTSRDPNADFDFNGTVNFNHKVPEMDFISTLNTLKLYELHFTNKSDSGSLSSQLFINIKGDNIDNLSGQINLDNTIYKTKTRKFDLTTLNLLLDQSGDDKKIKLNSGYINAIVRGNYKISNLAPAFEEMLYNYYPSYFKKPPARKKYTDQLVFKVSVKKFNVISELFLNDLMLSPGSTVDGNFNAAENKLNLQFNSGKFSYGSFNMTDLVFILNENNKTVLAEASGKTLGIGDSLSLANFNLSVSSIDKNSTYSMDWDNLKTPSDKGEIKGRLSFENDQFNLSNEKISVTVNDSTWNMTTPGSISFNRLNNVLLVNPLTISNKNQSINIAGAFSNRVGDSLIVNTLNVMLEQFNPLLTLLKLKLEGVMNGDVTLSNANNNFVLDGSLNLTKFKLNDNVIGELSITANYLTSEKQIRLNGYTSLGLQDAMGNQVKNISFNGNYYLDRREESLDLDFKANPANVKLLNPFLEGILTINKGFVSGEGKIHGSPDKIKLDGKLKLFNSEVRVDYTNVTYNITGDIEIMPDQIRFSDLLMRETGTRAPQGIINGNIFHTNFSRIQLDYDITYRNMLVLNTTERENKTFYGRVYGSGNVGIYGFVNNLHMKIRDTTTRNSKFFLPLDGPAEINEDDFVRFVRKDTIKVGKEAALTGFNLDLSVYATPAAQVQIILDKRNGDMLNVQGQGELNMKINTLGKFEMVGDYIITNGDYLFTLENVINKKFEIEAGSSISWSGDPLNADIDVVTSYKQRASVAPLLNDTTGQYKGRFPIDCKLIITGKLFSPVIHFEIDFPNIDATARARINNILSDEVELNRQVFSFLLFRTFVTPQIFNSSGGGVTAGNAAASTSSELLSNRVSEFLNTYFGNLTGLKDVQLGLNYRPGNQSNSEAVDLALSKQFFNNKISVDGNFGVNNNQARSSNGLIGDVNINYKLSEDGRYRLKGFNRTNDNTQVTTAGGPYTQGVGFFYREEFETFNDLFNMYLKRFRKKEKDKPKP